MALNLTNPSGPVASASEASSKSMTVAFQLVAPKNKVSSPVGPLTSPSR